MADGNNVQIARSLTSTIRADCSDSDWTRPVFMLASAVQIVGTCHSTGLRGTASHNYASKCLCTVLADTVASGAAHL